MFKSLFVPFSTCVYVSVVMDYIWSQPEPQGLPEFDWISFWGSVAVDSIDSSNEHYKVASDKGQLCFQMLWGNCAHVSCGNTTCHVTRVMEKCLESKNTLRKRMWLQVVMENWNPDYFLRDDLKTWEHMFLQKTDSPSRPTSQTSEAFLSWSISMVFCIQSQVHWP